MALWQYQSKAEPVTVPEPETGIDTKAWRPIMPDWLPPIPLTRTGQSVWTPLHVGAEGEALDWTARHPDRLERPWLPIPAQLSWVSGAQPPELSWRSVHPDWIDRRILPAATTALWTAALSPAFPPPALSWQSVAPEWLAHRTAPMPDLAWSTFTPAVVADVDWLPCVWMEEGVEEAMVASGTTAYQEQMADVLRLNGDPVTLNGEPIRVVS